MPAGRPSVLLLSYGPVLRPVGGWGVRSRVTLEVLAALGLGTTLLSTETEPVVGKVPDRSLSLRRKPWFGWSPELVTTLRRELPRHQAVIVENAMLLPAVFQAGASLPVVWDTNECQYLHYLRLGGPTAVAKRAVWHRLEAWAMRRCDLVVPISEAEAGHWRRLYPAAAAKIAVIEHAPVVSPALDVAQPGPHAPLRLLFVGNLVGKHNATAATWLLQNLAPVLDPGRARLVIAGPGTEWLRRPTNPAGVDCLGEVDDIDALVAGADLCLAPLLAGAGVKTKVLHYLAHGKPVLGTPVAFEGLEGAPGTSPVAIDGFVAATLGWIAAPSRPAPGAAEAWVEATHGRRLIERQWAAALERVGLA